MEVFNQRWGEKIADVENRVKENFSELVGRLNATDVDMCKKLEKKFATVESHWAKKLIDQEVLIF